MLMNEETGQAGGVMEGCLFTNLRVRHQKIAHLLIAGMTNRQVAEQVGVSVVTVGRLQENPQFKAYMQALLAKSEQSSLDVRKQISDLVPQALEKMAELSQSKNEKVAFSASKDLLDRAGYSPVSKQVNVDLNGDDVMRLEEKRLERVQQEIQRLKELGIVTPAIPGGEVSSVQTSDGSPLRVGVIELGVGEYKEVSPLTAVEG